METRTFSEDVTEKSLSNSWGLRVRELALVRQARLRENYHWVLRNSTVFYTADGVTELLKWVTPLEGVLETEKEEVISGGVEVVIPEGKRENSSFEVTRVPANPRMVLARCPSGVLVRIRVKNNKKFKRGMVIAGDAVTGELVPNALLDFTGKAPRFYGRW